MSDIDQFKYGQLTAQVQNLEDKVDKLEKGMEELLALANKSKGGFWAGMTIASFIGGLFTFLMNSWLGK